MAENSSSSSSTEDESEYFVVLQLPDSAIAGDTIQISDIQSNQPALRHLSNLYVGEYNNSIGTNLIFEQDQYDKQHRHISTTSKILQATEAILKPKKDGNGQGGNNPSKV